MRLEQTTEALRFHFVVLINSHFCYDDLSNSGMWTIKDYRHGVLKQLNFNQEYNTRDCVDKYALMSCTKTSLFTLIGWRAAPYIQK